ncbi:MAG TPA: hypothetical protein VKV39_20560 [Candidatus Sulfotelmatobacter sp.]|nr:hypothetical protein [Candidatus Sulfotelmatobacter sp.]
MRGLPNASPVSLLGLLLCMVPVIAGAWFAFRPSERLLSLMRPLTLGAVFSALCTFALAVANGCIAVSMMTGLDLSSVRWVATVLSEGLAPVVASLACLTVSWFLVAIGMRRS